MKYISKVNLNLENYNLKGDSANIEQVIASSPTIQDLYSKITTGIDGLTLLSILNLIEYLRSTAVSQDTINSLLALINALNGKVDINTGTVTYYIYKLSTVRPDRPDDSYEYGSSGWLTAIPTSKTPDQTLYMSMARKLNGNYLNWSDGHRWTYPTAMESSDGGSSVNITTTDLYFKVGNNLTLTTKERQSAAVPNGWSVNINQNIPEGLFLYMITAKSVNGIRLTVDGYVWSVPLRLGNGTTSGTGGAGYYFKVNPEVLIWDGTTYTTDVTCMAYYTDGTNRSYDNLKVQCGNLSETISTSGSEAGKCKFTAENLGGKLDSFTFALLHNNLPTGESAIITVVAPLQGINGAVLRYRGIWDEIVGYSNGIATNSASFSDGSEDANIKYIDVVSRKDTNNKLQYYQCNKENSINAGLTINPSDPKLPGGGATSPFWTPAHLFDFIVTDTLIADYMATKTLSAEDVVIVDKEYSENEVTTSIVAGMTSSEGNEDAHIANVGDVRIWAGTSGDLPNLSTAPFRVNLDGSIYAEDSTIQGTVKATSGSFEGIIRASSFMVADPLNPTVSMQFTILSEDVTVGTDDTYNAGTPVLIVRNGDDSYIVNMTKLTSYAATTITLYPLYTIIHDAETLKTVQYLNTNLDDGKLYTKRLTGTLDTSQKISYTTNLWLVTSTDPSLNGLVLSGSTKPQIEEDGTFAKDKLFAGCVLDVKCHNYTKPINNVSGDGQTIFYYTITEYIAGRENPEKLHMPIGSYIVEGGKVKLSNFADVLVDSDAPKVMSTSPNNWNVYAINTIKLQLRLILDSASDINAD